MLRPINACRHFIRPRRISSTHGVHFKNPWDSFHCGCVENAFCCAYRRRRYLAKRADEGSLDGYILTLCVFVASGNTANPLHSNGGEFDETTSHQNRKRHHLCGVLPQNFATARSGICSALQGFRHGSGGAMLRTARHAARGR